MQMAYNALPESIMQNMDPVMELTIQNYSLSRSRNPENETLFSGTSLYGKMFENRPRVFQISKIMNPKFKTYEFPYRLPRSTVELGKTYMKNNQIGRLNKRLSMAHDSIDGELNANSSGFEMETFALED